MKTHKRAQRRHDLARMKRKWLARQRAGGPVRDRHELLRRVGIRAHTAAPCSCWMCGNPRRYFGERSLQERRAEALPDAANGSDETAA